MVKLQNDNGISGRQASVPLPTNPLLSMQSQITLHWIMFVTITRWEKHSCSLHLWKSNRIQGNHSNFPLPYSLLKHPLKPNSIVERQKVTKFRGAHLYDQYLQWGVRMTDIVINPANTPNLFTYPATQWDTHPSMWDIKPQLVSLFGLPPAGGAFSGNKTQRQQRKKYQPISAITHGTFFSPFPYSGWKKILVLHWVTQIHFRKMPLHFTWSESCEARAQHRYTFSALQFLRNGKCRIYIPVIKRGSAGGMRIDAW